MTARRDWHNFCDTCHRHGIEPDSAWIATTNGVTAGRDWRYFYDSLTYMISIPENMVWQLEKELRAGWERNKIEAKVQARQIAKFNHERHKSVEGLGQKIATIPGTAYHFWGQKLGYGCWNDKAFMDEFLRDNPECRVNSGGVKEISVGWTPPSK